MGGASCCRVVNCVGVPGVHEEHRVPSIAEETGALYPMMGRKGGRTLLSYELDSTTEHVCPCGIGTYTVRRYSNDWGQQREEWGMNCPICKTEYECVITRYIPPGETKATRERQWLKMDY